MEKNMQTEGQTEGSGLGFGGRLFLAQADSLSSALIVHGYPRFASALVSSWARDAIEDAMSRLYPTAPTRDPWVRVGSEVN